MAEEKYTIYIGNKENKKNTDSINFNSEELKDSQKAADTIASQIEEMLRKKWDQNPDQHDTIELNIQADNEYGFLKENVIRRIKKWVQESHPDRLSEISGERIYMEENDYYFPDDVFENKKVEAKEPEKKPETPRIYQSSTGLSYLMTSLQAVVEKDKTFLDRMMKDNQDGTVTVQFYRTENDKKIPYNVIVEKTLLDRNTGSDNKVRLFEKAFMAGVLGKKTNQANSADLSSKCIAAPKSNTEIDEAVFFDAVTPTVIKKIEEEKERIQEFTKESEIENYFKEKVEEAVKKQSAFILQIAGGDAVYVKGVEKRNDDIVFKIDQSNSRLRTRSEKEVTLKDLIQGNQYSRLKIVQMNADQPAAIEEIGIDLLTVQRDKIIEEDCKKVCGLMLSEWETKGRFNIFTDNTKISELQKSVKKFINENQTVQKRIKEYIKQLNAEDGFTDQNDKMLEEIGNIVAKTAHEERIARGDEAVTKDFISVLDGKPYVKKPKLNLKNSRQDQWKRLYEKIKDADPAIVRGSDEYNKIRTLLKDLSSGNLSEKAEKHTVKDLNDTLERYMDKKIINGKVSGIYGKDRLKAVSDVRQYIHDSLYTKSVYEGMQDKMSYLSEYFGTNEAVKSKKDEIYALGNIAAMLNVSDTNKYEQNLRFINGILTNEDGGDKYKRFYLEKCVKDQLTEDGYATKEAMVKLYETAKKQFEKQNGSCRMMWGKIVEKMELLNKDPYYVEHGVGFLKENSSAIANVSREGDIRENIKRMTKVSERFFQLKDQLKKADYNMKLKKGQTSEIAEYIVLNNETFRNNPKMKLYVPSTNTEYDSVVEGSLKCGFEGNGLGATIKALRYNQLSPQQLQELMENPYGDIQKILTNSEQKLEEAKDAVNDKKKEQTNSKEKPEKEAKQTALRV